MRIPRMCLLLAVALVATLSNAQPTPFPSKPIRLIVDFPAGGTSDILARTIGQKLQESWGVAVVPENRVGANGIIANEQLAKAAPDGYTIGIISASLAVNLNLYPSLPFNTQKDFAPVTLIASTPNVLVVNPAAGIKSVNDLVARARQKPGQLNYASGGVGGSAHLAAEMLKKAAGIDMVHVPYNGMNPALNDMIGGRVDLMFAVLPVALPHIKSGKLEILAVADRHRSPVLPDVPTLAEAGVPGFVSLAWYGVAAPAGTPPEILDRYSAEIGRILKLPDVRERIATLGAEARPMTPAETSAFINDEIERYAQVIKYSGAKIDK
ncbi:MAG TPA: tripartite tricarboxylate transporter substrate binding protein [Casimicrobiaceae bacterium]|nr:tripartite tricarboxylate transporter substrate binding protein [Casimicrobiaceae bacterium]